MRVAILFCAIVTLAACDKSDPREGADDGMPDPSARTEEPPQTSIMRSDVAKPTEAPAPVEPLEIVIGFPDGGTEIPLEGIGKLRTLVGSVQIQQGGPIELAAHSDSAGSDSVNLRASRSRGEAVRAWLIDNGVEAERITLVAFGEQNPVEPNALPDGTPDEAGRAANRRVEINVPVPQEPVEEARRPTLAEEIVERTSDMPASGKSGGTETPEGD